MASEPAQHIGRIRLSEVAADWIQNQPINSRLLAAEVAGFLRTSGSSAQVIPEHCATVAMFDTSAGAGGITLDSLAGYFERLSEGSSQDTITTTGGPARTAAVLVARNWINRITDEATARAAIAAGLAQALDAHPANFTISSSAAPAMRQPIPPSGSSPECLEIRQAQQRLEGEQSASEQLEAERAARHLAELDNAKLSARVLALSAQHQQAQEAAEQSSRDLMIERRERTKLADLVGQNAGIVEFMNPANPLSPEEGRRLVNAWCELTENGTMDVVSQKGTGLQELCRRWLTSNGGAPAAVVVKRFVWALAWPARKKGGMVAKSAPNKG